MMGQGKAYLSALLAIRNRRSARICEYCVALALGVRVASDDWATESGWFMRI